MTFSSVVSVFFPMLLRFFTSLVRTQHVQVHSTAHAAETMTTTASPPLPPGAARENPHHTTAAAAAAADVMCSLFVAPSTVNEHMLGLFVGRPHSAHQPLLLHQQEEEEVTTYTHQQLLLELFDDHHNEWSPYIDFVVRGAPVGLPSLAHNFERDVFVPGIASFVDCWDEEEENDEEEEEEEDNQEEEENNAEENIEENANNETQNNENRPRWRQRRRNLVNVVATSINDHHDRTMEKSQTKIHRSTHATAGSFTEHSGFTFTTTRALEPGQEIFPSCRIIKAQHPLDEPHIEEDKEDSHQPPQQHVRSLAWLQEHAICIDTLHVQPSALPGGVGRGAFAKHAVPIGQPIATTPVIHLSRAHMHRVAQLRPPTKDGVLQSSPAGIHYHADQVLQQQLVLNYCWSHPHSNILLLPLGMGVHAINHYVPPKLSPNHTTSSLHSPNQTSLSYAPNAYIRWMNPKKEEKENDENNVVRNHLTMRTLTAHQLLDESASSRTVDSFLWVEVVALQHIHVGEEILLDYGAEWQAAWDIHEASYFAASSLTSSDDASYRSAADYLREHHHHDHHHHHENDPRRRRPFPTVTENDSAPIDQKLPPNLQTACLYRHDARQHFSSQFDPSVHASKSCLFPCSILERHRQRQEEENTTTRRSKEDIVEEEDYYTVHVYNRPGGSLLQEQECGILPVDGTRVSNVPADAITIADTPYSTDALRPAAFRHPMGVSVGGPNDDNGFWPASWMIQDPQPRGDFIPTPLAPAELQVIRWSDTGAIVHPNAYRIGFAPHFHTTLLRYCRDMGIVDVMRQVTVQGNAIPFNHVAHVTLAANDAWDLQRSPPFWRANLHWLSPGADAAYQHFLQALSVAGFDDILASIGQTLGLNHLVVFQPTFIAVSHCAKGDTHVDFLDTGNKTLDVLIPILLANDTGPEFVLESSTDEDTHGNLRLGRYRYEPHVGSIVGDNAVHGTNAADYRSTKEMRLVASIYIAEITEDNVNAIMSHYNHAFPPNDRNLLLSWAGMHWSATDPTKKLPSPPADHILLVHNNSNNTANPFSGRLELFQGSYEDSINTAEADTDDNEEGLEEDIADTDEDDDEADEDGTDEEGEDDDDAVSDYSSIY